MIPSLCPDACRARRETLRKQVSSAHAGVDALLVSRPEHVYYLTGFLHDPNNINNRAPQYLLIDADGGASLVIDGFGPNRPGLALMAENGIEVITGGWAAFDPLVPRTIAAARAVAAELGRRGIGRLGAEPAHLPRAAADEDAVVVDVEPLITRMRRRG